MIVIIFHLCNVLLVQGQFYFPVPLSDSNGYIPDVLLLTGLNSDSVSEAFSRAQDVISSRQQSVANKRRVLDPRQNIPSARHQKFHAIHPTARISEAIQERFEETTKILRNMFNLTLDQIMFELPEIDHKSMFHRNIVENCEAQFDSTCRENSRYRSFDGSCNNLWNPSWGRAATCHERLLDPDYADGIANKRVAISGNPLPPPRKVSLEIHSNLNITTEDVTHILMVFGQFLAHDISLTPLTEKPNGQPLECCPVGDDDPQQCDPILLEQDDPFFSLFEITCLNNQRSAKCSTCSLGPRQQINQLSSYIDASQVYGLSQEASSALRNNDGTGTLRSVNFEQAGELPPPSSKPAEDFCSFQDRYLNCFETGDIRANQHPALTSMHVLFLREHNRIARILRQINPQWNEEQIFQESRRIIGAMLQMITYNEFLPLVIGQKGMNDFNLNVLRSGYSQYDDTVKANIFNEFSTAAFRFGHSMINSFFPHISTGYRYDYRLQDIFLYPFGLYRGELEGLVNGLTKCPAQRFDRYMVRDVTNHLYQFHKNKTGLDLASINVNRGRDHGIPSYTRLLEFCGGPRIQNWRQLDNLFRSGVTPRFQKLYEDVRDIDLFSGGLAERPNQGAIIGPTFAYIVGRQFYHLKYGDRFYFEHGDQEGSFTPAQLQEIRKVTLSKIICDNSNLSRMQQKVMLYPSDGNPVVNCDDLPEMDLRAWRQ